MLMTINEKMKIYRKRAKITQAEASEILNCSLVNYYKKESGIGNFSIEDIVLLKDVLGYEYEELLNNSLFNENTRRKKAK